jgi:hypothetical protein
LINSKWRKEKPQNIDECMSINNNQAIKATYQMFLNAPRLVLINWLRPFVKAEDEVKEAFSMLSPYNYIKYISISV